MNATILPPATGDSISKVLTPGASNLQPTTALTESINSSSAAIFKDLRLAAEKLNAIEGARKPLGQLAADYQAKGIIDVEFLGYLKGIEDVFKAEEHQAVLELQRIVRKHPLYPWIKRTIGLGEKQMGRLLASLGPGGPDWNTAEDRPRRGPAELWAFCGYAPDQQRRKGQVCNWNHEAKMRAFLIADSCLIWNGKPDKNGKRRPLSPYRAVYDAAKTSWADRDTTDLHKHNHALRVTAKAILRHLWREARNLRGDQWAHDTQRRFVPADLPPTKFSPKPTRDASAADLVGEAA